MSNQYEGEELVITVEDQIESAWALSGANQPVTEADSEAARERLTDYDFRTVVELETIIGLEDKNSVEYREAQAALVRRSQAEYAGGHSGGQFYAGNGPRLGNSSGR